MLKVSSILMAVCICLTCIFTCAVPVYASSVFYDFAASSVLDFFTDLLSSYHDNITKKQEAARAYFFTYITSNKYGYSGEIFASEDKFDEKYLEFVFDKYLQNAYYSSSPIDSDGDVFLSAAGFSDTHFSVSLTNFYSSHSNSLMVYGFNHEDCPTNFNYFKNYYQSFLARYILAQGGEAIDPNPGKSGLEIAPGYVTSEEFKSELDRLNELYTPKGNDLFLNSYRTDTYYHTDVSWAGCFYYDNVLKRPTNDSIFSVTLYQNPSTREGLNDLWCLPFYKSEAGEMYYNDFLFHLYYISEDDPNADTALVCDVYTYNSVLGWIKQDSCYTVIYEFNQSLGQEKPYQLRFFCNSESSGMKGSSSQFFSLVKTFDDYSHYDCVQCPTQFNDVKKFYYSSDRSKTLSLFSRHYTSSATGSDIDVSIALDFFGKSSLSTSHDHDPNYTANPNKNNDYGFICSESMIDLHWDFDTSKIQDGQIVEVNGGDNIYNYNITNPSTGQTSTVNEYITNNYTYIEESGGEQGSGGTGGTGGSVSGNVDVSGEVGVNGEIDVNVNVNNGPSAYPDTDLIGNLPEAPKNFLDYLGILFSFLPAPVLYLLIGGIAAAIFCRLWGR